MSTNWYDDPSAPLSRDDVRNEIQNFLQSQSAASSYAPKGTPWQAVDLPLVTVLPSKPQGRDEVNLLNTVTNGVTRWIYLTKTAAWAQISGPPIGVIEWTCAAAAPLGYLIADGTAVSRITYAGLFALCSTTYGVGDGTTTFNVPDLRGRVPLGAGTGNQLNTPTGSGVITGGTPMTPRSVGAWGGEETHLLSTSEMPSHSHGTNTGTQSADHSHTTGIDYRLAGGSGANYAFITDGSGTVVGPVTTTSGGVSVNHTHAITPEGGGARHAVVNPFVVLSYIIKT